MRKLTAINFINHFFWAAIVITLPLYLIEKDINVEEIGLILAVIPLVMMGLRTFLAMLSDTVGLKIFFVWQGICQAAAAGAYLVATVPLQFAAGKFFEGSAYSLFWAVDRTAIYETAKKRDLAAAQMSYVRMIAAALGLGLAGFAASAISFDAVYLGLAVLGMATVVLGFARHESKIKRERKPLAKTLHLRAKRKEFWEASLAMGLNVVYFSVLFVFLLPIFMDLVMVYSYATIGFLLMLFYACMGAGAYVATKLELSEARTYFFQLVALPCIVFMPYSPQFFAPLLLIAGFGIGVSGAMFEELIARITEKEKDISTSIAILHIPGRVFEFVGLAVAGYVYTIMGNESVFALCAILMLGFVAITKDVLDKLDKEAKVVKTEGVPLPPS